MSGQQRRFIQRFLAVFAALFFIVFPFVPIPAQAFVPPYPASLCVADPPACAAVAQTVVEAVPAVLEVGAATVAAPVSIAILTAAAVGLGLNFLSQNDLNKIQPNAIQQYLISQSPAYSGWHLEGMAYQPGCTGPVFAVIPLLDADQAAAVQFPINNYCPGSLMPIDSRTGGRIGENLWQSVSVKPPITDSNYGPLPALTPEQISQGISQIPPSDLVSLLGTGTSTGISLMPGDTVTLNPSSGSSLGGIMVPASSTDDPNTPEDETIPRFVAVSGGFATYNVPGVYAGSSVAANAGSETTTGTGTVTDPCLSGGNCTVTAPQVQPIEPQQFQGENWLTHGKNVFSQKFPFDIFGTVTPEVNVPDCPTYTFFDYPFELCPIKDFFAIFKWPVLIGFAVWSYQQI